MLIKASAASRTARGYSPTGALLYGYGLFQNDLQNISTDPEFWRNALWSDVGACLDRFVGEFGAKLKAHPNDRVAAYSAYNGSPAYGPIIARYRELAQAELRV